MHISTTIQELRSALTGRLRAAPITLIPTMGYLHQGHLSLVSQAKKYSDTIVATIFVNPTQFNNKEDFEKYPINIEQDTELLHQAGATHVFIPKVVEIYGTKQKCQCWVEVEDLTKNWEGTFRPGHFRGVSTIVSMLFNIVQPTHAIFGEKDFQQLRVIETMVERLHFPIEIHRGPTIREADGLAMSSRNVRLSKELRENATAIFQGLVKAQTLVKAGERSALVLEKTVSDIISQSTDSIEYIACVDEEHLVQLEEVTNNSRILVAANYGNVRLIDNMKVL